MPSTFSVRNILLLLFVLQLFAGKVVMDEAMKLPYLWSHYRQTASTDSFVDYLNTHYANSTHRKADPEHHHLPFFSAEFSLLLAMKPEAAQMPVRTMIPVLRRDVFADTPLLPADFRNGVLHPPEWRI